jgi:hypothetical protein
VSRPAPTPKAADGDSPVATPEEAGGWGDGAVRERKRSRGREREREGGVKISADRWGPSARKE